MRQPIVIELSEPIQAIDRAFERLELREPRGKDLREIGTPVSFGSGGGFTIDSERLALMIARLANIPESSVDQLSAFDWMLCQTAIMGFLGPAGASAPSSTGTTSAPAGGAT